MDPLDGLRMNTVTGRPLLSKESTWLICSLVCILFSVSLISPEASLLLKINPLWMRNERAHRSDLQVFRHRFLIVGGTITDFLSAGLLSIST